MKSNLNLNLYNMLDENEELRGRDLKSNSHLEKSIKLVNIRVKDALYDDLCTSVTLQKLSNKWYWKINFVSMKNSAIYISLFYDEEIRVMSELSYFRLSYDYRPIQKKLIRSSFLI